MNRAIGKLELSSFAFLGIATIVSVLAAFATQLHYLVLIPFGLLIIYTGVINFRLLYFMLLAAIPLSMEYSFSDSLGTDLPDEPMMIGLMFVTFIFLAANSRKLPTGFFGNMLIFAIVVYLFWIFIAALNSVNPVVSFKIFSAKVWYITTFCLLTAVIIKTNDDFKKAFWFIYTPLTILIIQVLIRQALYKFSFDDINKAMWPFFRNHVNYSAILSVFFPFILLARGWYAKGTHTRRLLTFSIPLFLVAMYFSYARTSYLAVALIFPFYFIIRHQLMKPVLAVMAVGVTVLMVYLFSSNHFLKYAPAFDETIYHEDFEKHLSSTFEGKDVSSMERVYRWVAATRMFKDHPWMGFGPGNFYPYYKSYTLSSFETYVSDNPERSTTHNYPLLMLTEQGVIGLSVFIFLTAIVFIYGEKIYHRITNEEDKKIAMTLLLVLGMVYVNLLLSDLLESDKVGPFFYICISLLAVLDIRNRTAQKELV